MVQPVFLEMPQLLAIFWFGRPFWKHASIDNTQVLTATAGLSTTALLNVHLKVSTASSIVNTFQTPIMKYAQNPTCQGSLKTGHKLKNHVTIIRMILINDA